MEHADKLLPLLASLTAYQASADIRRGALETLTSLALELPRHIRCLLHLVMGRPTLLAFKIAVSGPKIRVPQKVGGATAVLTGSPAGRHSAAEWCTMLRPARRLSHT
jgi:hypothetical protein